MGYFLVKAKVQGRNVKAIVNRIAKYIIAIFAIFLAMYFVTKLMKMDIVERLNEMLNGDTNGRSAIWEKMCIRDRFYIEIWLFSLDLQIW